MSIQKYLLFSKLKKYCKICQWILHIQILVNLAVPFVYALLSKSGAIEFLCVRLKIYPVIGHDQKGL